MEFNLKPCPFCGLDQAEVYKNQGRRGVFLYVKCECCGAQSKTIGTRADFNDPYIFDSQECDAAVRAWNMRGGVLDA